jgi:hypothetical protein
VGRRAFKVQRNSEVQVRKLSAIVLVLVAVIGSASTRAETISVSSSADLTNLTVGVPVMFDVRMSGLAAGDTLSFLGTTISFDEAIFGTPTITPGAIVPDPLRPSRFPDGPGVRHRGCVVRHGLHRPGLPDRIERRLLQLHGLPYDGRVWINFDLVRRLDPR